METKHLLAPMMGVENSQAVREAAAILRRGGLVAIPTETVYGLAANALVPEAVKRIFVAKGRPQDNPLIVHIADMAGIESLIRTMPPCAVKLADAFWPGPLTMVFPKTDLVPDVVSGGLDTVAIRIPAHPVAREIIRTAGIPLAAPSANRSGKPSPTTAQHVLEDLGGRIDAVLDAGPCSIGVESTVVSLRSGTPHLLRPGGITPKELETVAGNITMDAAVLSQMQADETPASPGMKYRHYAPQTKLVLVQGSWKEFLAYVLGKDKPYGVLCFDEDAQAAPQPCLTYGSIHDANQQAVQLFDALRRVDTLGVGTVYVRAPAAEGVGLAVYNRLLRAAAFRVVSL